jgi:hypothetical protein
MTYFKSFGKWTRTGNSFGREVETPNQAVTFQATQVEDPGVEGEQRRKARAGGGSSGRW